ncbi:MAG: hypothetical protein Kow0089_13160 [Desulfobulbaceae bacterium]
MGGAVEMRGCRLKKIVVCVVLSFLVLAPATAPAGEGEQTAEQGFVKLDGQGRELPPEAEQWAIVLDRATGLYWEVKTTDGSIHDKERTFDWQGAHDEFLEELNREAFGGFTDWRLPTTDELRSIRVKGAEPYIDPHFFPNTVATGYMSWRKCGNGEVYDERVKFGKIRNTKKDRRVRAVRSGPVPEK